MPSIRRFLRFRVMIPFALLIGVAQLINHITRLKHSTWHPHDSALAAQQPQEQFHLNLSIPELLSAHPPPHALPPSPPSPNPNSPEESEPEPEPKLKPQWCKQEECLSGSWTPRSPSYQTLADLQKAYMNPQEPVWSGCRVPDKDLTDLERSEKMAQRLLDVMNWEWLPDNGKKMRVVNVEELVVRLLRSAGGIILIGAPPQKRSPTHPTKQHPPRTRLIARAGVPASRLQRPIFTFLEEHMLIGEPEIREITAMYGASKEDYPWYHDFQRVEGWEDFVRDAVAWREDERGYVTEDSVVVLNTGAHWSRHEYTMLPTHDTQVDQQHRLELTFKQMMRRVRSRLTPLTHLTIIYRPTAPGHPRCDLSPRPYPSLPYALEAESPSSIPGRLLSSMHLNQEEREDRLKWDWDRFNVHNLLWKESIRKMGETRKRLGWVYLDVWGLALQRPDAHAESGVDCLHWCLPGMLEEWNKQIYQVVVPIDGEDGL
ncbi:hypothetical protein BDQ17DRAFT_1374939 [Cyathus striatus]|nr:hypothetical protein BDQ17DRAFT_1374939 [Cyathus striatus]